jgi:prepilin-type N-terminal cleavage/methylation domain-containing protein
MQHTVLRDRGVSLVEVVIALTVLLLVSLALMQTALLSIEVNTKNTCRDIAVSIAAERMDASRGLAFDAILSDAAALPVGVDCPPLFAAGQRHQMNLRNVQNKDFCSNRSVTVLDATGDNKQVDIRVTWNWKGEPFSYTATTIIRRPNA